MYLLLLAFGFALTVAGVVLAASGISLQDHSFDTSIITPGVVAAVGGLLLIGLGLALRVLGRIETALAVRPIALARATETAAEAEPVAMPPKPMGRLPAAAGTVPSPLLPTTAEKRADALSEKMLARAEAEPLKAIQEPAAEASAVPTSPTSLDAAAAATIDRIRARRRNGSTAPRIAPRLDLPGRSSNPAERPAGPAFDTLWPKTSRTAATAPVAAPAIPETAPASAPEPESETVPETVAVAPAIEEVTVLKSGVVDGMAYTLFSDGSIEAQLPQGALRFGSITELRNHIEQSA